MVISTISKNMPIAKGCRAKIGYLKVVVKGVGVT